MHNDHYAILIGLSRYAGLGPPPADLQGPANDVDLVHEWLVAPKGGGLPPENVMRVVSADYPEQQEPTRDQMEKAFIWIDNLARASAEAGNGRQVGARLYFYLSGHGFSPDAREGLLLASNAAPNRFTANIGASEWLKWWQDAGYFREYVLWMDCCMNRLDAAVPTPAPLAALRGDSPPLANFIAFAAQRSLKAVEGWIPEDGKFHGLFTWNLVTGLRGAATGQFGTVDGPSLADWLENAQLPWLSEDDRKDPDVSKRPEIVARDPGLVFANAVAPPSFHVTLRFPAHMAGMRGRLWEGDPASITHEFDVAESLPLDLAPGLYVAEVAGATLRQGFQVVRSQIMDLADRGPAAVAAPGASFWLRIGSADPTAEMRVVTARLQTVSTGSGRLDLRLPFGVYKVEFRVGKQILSHVRLLDRDLDVDAMSLTVPPPDGAPPDRLVIELPKIVSAAPLPGTAATHEYHELAAVTSPPPPAPTARSFADGARLTLMARSFSPETIAPNASPWSGVRVVDAEDKVVADLGTQGSRASGEDPDPYAVLSLDLSPGTYFLRYSLRLRDPLEQALILPPGGLRTPQGWQVEAYLLRRSRAPSGQDSQAEASAVSLLMRPLGATWGAAEDLILEKARVALAEERPILNDELDSLLLHKFTNPLAGIIGAHLLLIEPSADGNGRLKMLNEVVANLRDLVGFGHPDVEALSLRCPDPTLRSRKPFVHPPMFERSWRLIINASQEQPDLVPLMLWQRVHLQSSVPPFFVWCTDETVQAEYREALQETLFRGPAAAVEAARVNVDAAPAKDFGAYATEAGGVTSFGQRSGMYGEALVRGPSLDLKGDAITAPASLPQPDTRLAPQETDRLARGLRLPPAAVQALRGDAAEATWVAHERGNERWIVHDEAAEVLHEPHGEPGTVERDHRDDGAEFER